MSHTAPVLLIADPRCRNTAERLLAACPDLIRRDLTSETADPVASALFAETLRELFGSRTPTLLLGDAGAAILALAPILAGLDPAEMPPLLVAAPDGSAVLPLLGSGRGSDALAARLAAALRSDPALARVQDQPRRAHGRLAVVGLGPGAAELMAPAVRKELTEATDIVGYTTYVRMAGPFRPDQVIRDSDNRQEMDRARLAFTLAAEGRHVVVVSSGDPGVFAMATAVVEALHQSDDPAWLQVELAILPGISAAHAAAARVGAPLGHDFCIISLSDNLKPWSQIERRLEQAAAGDFVIALYNPRSLARPAQFEQALGLLRRLRSASTPVVLGHDVGRPTEYVETLTLGEVRPEQVDMRTLVIVGSSLTRRFPRLDGGHWVYTPRWYGDCPDTPEPPQS